MELLWLPKLKVRDAFVVRTYLPKPSEKPHCLIAVPGIGDNFNLFLRLTIG